MQLGYKTNVRSLFIHRSVQLSLFQSLFPVKVFCNVHHSSTINITTPQLATPIYEMETVNISLFCAVMGIEPQIS